MPNYTKERIESGMYRVMDGSKIIGEIGKATNGSHWQARALVVSNGHECLAQISGKHNTWNAQTYTNTDKAMADIVWLYEHSYISCRNVKKEVKTEWETDHFVLSSATL